MLTFSPEAWLKLQFFCHSGQHEIGGFGVSLGGDLLHVAEFHTVPQRVTRMSVTFDDDGVADFVDDCVDRGLQPRQCMRIWCHTHPGESPEPSHTDHVTFANSFGSCDWSVMFILGRTGKTYARLQLTSGPGLAKLIPVSVDWSDWPLAAEKMVEDDAIRQWQHEFDNNIFPDHPGGSMGQFFTPSHETPTVQAATAAREQDLQFWEQYERHLRQHERG